MEWISTKEQVPAIGVWILFFSWRGITIGSYWGGLYKTDQGTAVSTNDVTHWQPLPPPPKP